MGSDATVQNFIKPSMYDAEANKTFDHHSDVEYGITITKVCYVVTIPICIHIH